MDTIDLRKKINIFFEGSNEGQISSLNLLKKHIDICLCLGDYANNRYEAVWPAVLAIFAGIDSLAYYRYKERFVKKRFELFLKNHLNLEEEDQKNICGLRNAMVHEYSLTQADNENFIVTYEKQNENLIYADGGKKVINLYVLYERFKSAISRYHDELNTELGNWENQETSPTKPEILRNFEEAFDERGLIVSYPVPVADSDQNVPATTTGSATLL